MAKFKNEAVTRIPDRWTTKSNYGFNHAPKLLFSWSRLFQTVISQAGTYLLANKFHKEHCSIYKCEGGVRIAGVGDFVLLKDGVYKDGGYDRNRTPEEKLAELITFVVLHWDPENPINSMILGAASFIGVETQDLKNAVKDSENGGVFGGNALSDFFDWNPFSETIHDRDYLRYCLTTFEGWTDAQVDQKYADEDLGKNLLKQLKKAAETRSPGPYKVYPMCCSPRRDGENLRFWVNTGGNTNLDGWKTQAELETWLASGDTIINSGKW